MRTTVDLPDALFRQVKAQAALEGTSLKDLLTRYVASGLQQPGPPAGPRPQRSPLPILKRQGKHTIPNLTSERQASLDEEEDLAKLQRSLGS